MDHGGQIATVVQNHVQWLTVGEIDRLLDAPVKFFVGHPFPRVDRDTGCSDSGGSVILSGEDVAAAPCHFSTQSGQCFDQHCRLDGHMEATSDAGTGQGLGLAIFRTKRHQAGHFVFCDFDFFTTECCESDILDFVGDVLSLGGF